MQRSKFPYTALPSAKFIRHAVSIDERRVKFRQDLMSRSQAQKKDQMRLKMHRYESDLMQMNGEAVRNDTNEHQSTQQGPKTTMTGGQLPVPAQPATHSSSDRLAPSMHSATTEHQRNRAQSPRKRSKRTWSQAKRPQDVQEVWFPGA